MKNIVMSEGKVLIKTDEFEAEVSSNIIIIPEVAKKTPPMKGVVSSVHKDESTLKVGDKVLYARFGVEFFDIEDEKYLIIDRSAVIAKLS